MRSARGSALILALWAVTLLTVTAVSIGYGIRQKLALMTRLDQLDTLQTAAYSAVEKAKGIVRDDTDADYDAFVEEWASNATVFRQRRLGRTVFTVSYEMPQAAGEPALTVYGAMDEARKINLNTADAPTLSLLLQRAAGLAADEAEPIAYAIVDWRDGDSGYGHPRHGAEDTDYTDLDVPYGCKDAPFETVDELLLIQGINRALFDRIRDLVTPFGDGRVNLNTAPVPVLQALGFDVSGAEALVKFRNGPDGRPGSGDDQSFTDTQVIPLMLEQSVSPVIDAATRARVENLILAEKVSVGSQHFMARAAARFGERGPYVEVESVFDRNGKTFYARSSGVRWPSRR
jgi:general secretion pathway protein K